jgi:hypothetical protein
MTTVKFVSRVFTVLGQNLVRTCTADLLIDLPEAVERLDNGEVVRGYARKSGFDLYSRFEACLKEELRDKHSDEPITYDKVIDKVNRSLGFIIEVTMYPDRHVELRLNDTVPYEDKCYTYYEVGKHGLMRYECTELNCFARAVKKDLDYKCEVVLSRGDFQRIVDDMAWMQLNPIALN